MKKNLLLITAALLILLTLPLLGVWLAGHEISQYLEFPPLTRYVAHADFSWPIFIGLTVFILAVILPFEIRVFSRRGSAPPLPHAARPLPYWGWLSLVTGIVSWLLAWTRFSWFEPFQLYTFTPLWLSYIVFINALTFKRTGRCLLKNRPRFFLFLFPVSATFWWFFEYLNRFVQNWYYINEEGFTKTEYFLLATLAFSTVLPAVLSTFRLLKSIPRVGAGLDNFLPIRVKKPRLLAWTALILSCCGLAFIGALPDYLFPLLWLAPLLILTSLQSLMGRETLFSPIGRGDWRRIYTLALAALICGFFWEMWNFFSLL